MEIEKKYKDIEKEEEKLRLQRQILLEEAEKSSLADDRIFYNQLKKGNSKKQEPQDNIDNLTSYQFDPDYHQTFEAFNYLATFKSLGFDELRLLARSLVVRTIVLTRQDQSSEYSKPAYKKGEKGWVIEKKRSFYSEEADILSDEDKSEIKRIGNFIWNCGQDDNELNDNFDKFLRKIIKDSLELDNAPVEKVRTRTNKLYGFQAVDGATIYLTKPYNDPKYVENVGVGTDGLPPKKNGYYPKYCQVFHQNETGAVFFPDELFVIQRNPTTDVYKNGYGYSELEDLVPYLNWLWFSDEHNGKFFTNGSAPKGFFTLAEGSASRIKDFKQQYSAQNKSYQNSHKLMIFSGDIKWNDMQKSNRDMEYEAWKDYLIKVTCAMYKIDPAEISFSFKNSGVYGANDKEMRKHSMEKGLVPLLKTIGEYINKHIMEELNPNYVFKFVGFENTEKADVDIASAEISSYKTINEVRREKGLEELVGDEYDTVLNPVLVQIKQTEQQMGAMEDTGVSPQTEKNVDKMMNDFNIE